jgi:hypothetical protein
VNLPTDLAQHQQLQRKSIKNNSTSPGVGIGNEIEIAGDFNATDKTQTEMMIKLMEKLIELLGKK